MAAATAVELTAEIDAVLAAGYQQALGEEAGAAHWAAIKAALRTPPPLTTIRSTQVTDLDPSSDARTINGAVPSVTAELLRLGAERHALLPEVVCLPTRGPCSVEPTGLRVIVSLACGMAIWRGAHVFAPGIKSLEAGIVPDSSVAVYADVDDAYTRGHNGPCDHRLLFVGNGIAHVARATFFKDEQPRGLAITMTAAVFQTMDLPPLEPNAILQNLPSCVAARALAPEPGMRVLDMCAAPGGKTSHISLLLRGTGTVVALERSPKRAAQLKEWVASLGCHNVEVHQMDATKCLEGSKGKNSKFPLASFDAVLLDAPCSGLGQRPRVRVDCPLRVAELEDYASYQRKLLQVAVAALRPGGRLVFSTCSLFAGENEANVAWALKAMPELTLVDAGWDLGSPGLEGHGLEETQRRCVRRFDPVHDGTIAFFLAKFEKRATSPAPVAT